MRFLYIILAWFLSAVYGQECSLSCAVGETCYATAEDALDCLYSIPFNEEWANTTLDVLSQSLENFGFDALYHATGPPYSISMDIQGELSATQDIVNAGGFATDIDFQEHLQSIFQRTIDAHTRYQKPACYNAIFIQPFAFDMRVEDDNSEETLDNEPVVYLMRNLYTDTYAAVYPEIDIDVLIDQQVTLLNGLEFTTEVSGWGDTHETRSNNRGIRFNAAIRSYLYRSAISVGVLPVEDLQLTLSDGSVHTIPWLASYTTGLANTTLCAAVDVEEVAAPQLKQSSSVTDPMHRSVHEPAPTLTTRLHESRPDREEILPPDSPYYVSCFVQSVTGSSAKDADVSKVLVMKVASFSPPGEDYLDAWEGFLDDVETCLSVDFDMIVVDVMQNGGGYVCLGLRLIELLVEEYENDHTKVQMRYDLPHSPLMDRYIDVVNAPDPYPYAGDVEQILDRDTQESFPDGRAYYYPGRNVTQGGVTNWRTNIFSLDCREAEAMPSNGFRPAKFVPPEKLIILTDGTCGSTCASFTKIPQEDGTATFVGAGGIWDEGMDVSSFAGGFVCNPDYLANIAEWSNTTFPKFATNQRWQFGWATWYSQKLPSRPVQFTVQDPDYREAFWGFPHTSIDAEVTTAMVSSLYDRVIESTLDRLASAESSKSSCSSSLMSNKAQISILSLAAALFAALLIVVTLYFMRPRTEEYSGVRAEDENKDLEKRLLD